MRIGIDIDGCVRDIHAKLIQVYKREMGIRGDGDDKVWCEGPEKWNKYNISPHFSIGDEIYNFWFHTHAEEIYTKSLPFPGVGLLGNLVSYGHDLIVLTDQPNPGTAKHTVSWVYDHLPVKELHLTPNKHLVECDIYLDDAPHHLKEFEAYGLNYVIMSQPWNINEEDLNGATRINNLYDFKELILKGVK